MAYARAIVYALGLPPEAFARPPRLIEGVTPSNGTLALRSHGLAADAPVTLAVLSSSTLGAPAAALPTGLSTGVTYYAQLAGSSDLFTLATAAGGASIATFGDAGAGVFGIIVDHGPYLDAAIVAAEAVVNEHARAHRAPIQAAILPLVIAYLAARIYIAAHAAVNPEYAKAAEAPSWLRSLLDTLFKLWLSGAEMAGAVDADPQVAQMGPKAVRLRGRGYLRIDDREDLV